MPKRSVTSDLQPMLADLISLSLQAKQAHWNVFGPLFGPLHELFDRMTDAYRGWYDDVAERIRALQGFADGRVAAVSGSKVTDLPAGEIIDRDSVAFLLTRVEGVAARMRAKLPTLGEDDPVSQDLVIGIIEGLEKQAWMLRSQKA